MSAGQCTGLLGKKILIFGSEYPESYMVEELQKEGCFVIVTDNKENLDDAPAKQIANAYWNISYSDINALKERALHEGVEGIVIGFSEIRMEWALRLANALNLPMYFNEKQLAATRIKDVFKAMCETYGIGVPRNVQYNDETIHFPVIVKPVDNAGSKGIRICHNRLELDAAMEYALSYSPSKRILIEEYLVGQEVVLYYTIAEGEVVFTGMCDRYTNNEQGVGAQLPKAYIFPSKHIQAVLKTENKKIQRMFQNEGFTNGCVFIQAFFTQGELKVYEMGYRLNGARENIFVEYFGGVDNLKLLANYAVHGTMGNIEKIKQLNPVFGKLACKLTPLMAEGEIFKIEGLDEIAAHKNVIRVLANKKVGSKITAENVGTLMQVVARIFIVAENWKALKLAIDECQSYLKVTDIDGNDLLLNDCETSMLECY